ncbi:hypothetical protein L1047_02895 [Synechococcus sp. Nb3U1]|uniref:hypothetical protein n=1 Tax=Synechococcus sp. Nb3U1 TaxID=1914529 RepID=UPI001F3731A5|nr:hypothetical protein [Synechococcus sp. Nb3U1]MCF2970144.1 hypothetical protein [Synechococcus sp. Nb3U1]
MLVTKLKTFFTFFGALGIPFVLLTLVLVGLEWAWGWVSLEDQFLGYKGSVAAVGPDPRLSVVGISFPPLLVLGTALLGSPLLLRIALGSLLLLWGWRQLAQLPVGVGWRWLWGMLIALQPSFGLMLLRSPGWIATAGLLGVNMTLLLPLSRVGKVKKDAEVDPGTGSPALSTPEIVGQSQRPLPLTLRLVLLGLCLAPLMLLRWESWWLLIWVDLLVLLAFWRESWGFRGTAVLVVSFMSLALILGWLYMNGLAVGDPWAFVYQPSSGLRLPQLQAWLISAGGWDSLAQAGIWLLVVVPAYLIVGVGTMVQWIGGRWVWALGWACPVVLLVASLGQGLFVPELSRFGVFWMLMPLLLGSYLQVGRGGWGQRLGITAALLLSLLTSGYVLTHGTLIPEEQDLWQRLQASSRPPSQLVQQWQTQRQEQRQVGQYLLQHLLPGQRVLVDDALHFEAIFWAGDPRLFITPHQHEFSIALQQPQEQVDYLLLAGLEDPLRSSDRLLQFWPELNFGSLPEFVEVYGSPQVRLLAR